MQIKKPWLVTILKKKKLKKKWRYWRKFKFFFLKKIPIFQFLKVKSFFNYNRIMWHYFKKYYGSKIKYLVLHKSKKKIAYNSKFIFFLSLLELRLNVILLRMLFVFKLVEANFLIRYGFINVNKKKKQTNYIVNIKDVIQKNIILVNKKIRKKKWRIYQWRKWRFNIKIKSKKKRKFYWQRKITLSINYIEINYKILTGILIRKPVVGEILIRGSNKLDISCFLKKMYFLY